MFDEQLEKESLATLSEKLKGCEYECIDEEVDQAMEDEIDELELSSPEKLEESKIEDLENSQPE